MSFVAIDPVPSERMLAERRNSGGDRYDEVWERVYVMSPSPLADNEHQELATGLGAVYKLALGWDSGHKVYTGVNVSDRDDDWWHNYRVSDNAVFLEGNRAKDCGTHWCGGPDFLDEIISKGDRSLEKLPFYQRLGVREVLLVDRVPWALELSRLIDRSLQLVGRIEPGDGKVLASNVLPFTFRLQTGPARPVIEVSHTDGVQGWRV